MSARRLRCWVLGIIGWLIIYAAAYAYGVHQKCNWADTLKDLIPIVLAISVTILAAGFNRRNSYLAAMRELWWRLIPAVQSAIQYTHLETPTQSDFSKTQKDLDSAIDLLRGVFANVKKSGAPWGLYPYENIKDIHKIIRWLNFGENYRIDDAKSARKCITRLWQEMHNAMLHEFDRDIPLKPVSKFLWDEQSLSDLLIKGELNDDYLSLERAASHPFRLNAQPHTRPHGG